MGILPGLFLRRTESHQLNYVKHSKNNIFQCRTSFLWCLKSRIKQVINSPNLSLYPIEITILIFKLIFIQIENKYSLSIRNKLRSELKQTKTDNTWKILLQLPWNSILNPMLLVLLELENSLNSAVRIEQARVCCNNVLRNNYKAFPMLPFNKIFFLKSILFICHCIFKS